MNKKKMAIVCFTPQGQVLAEKVQAVWSSPVLEADWSIEFVYKPVPFRDWMLEHFQELDALVFIGAMGIVVRDMAPCLKSKLTDPAVVVLDEKGQFVISVLSGHIGGGNALTLELAKRVGATPVVTTSSDVNGKIAIDVFAQKNHLFITSMKQAKLCASDIVSGYPVSFFCDGTVIGTVPRELGGKSLELNLQEADVDTYTDVEDEIYQKDPKERKKTSRIVVSPKTQQPSDGLLHLIPQAYVLGVGCKKGTSKAQLEARIKEELDKLGIDIRSIKGMASIDIKQEEAGLLDFAKKRRIPIAFYSAEELSKLEGDFTPSSFVSTVTGVENVCERAGFMLAKENGATALSDCLVLPKSGKDGVTVAIMKLDWSVRFD
ncbi:MAG: cobalt-precorrin 5A hydrolase [Eubacterium sp.]|nr:cobalt-precorrin 5A hydrolase [Eubacterium sp.]